MSDRADKHMDEHTHGHTDADNDYTRKPKLASGKYTSAKCQWAMP